MFMGPFDQAIAWDTNNIAGSRRFVERVWKLQDKVLSNKDDKNALVEVNKKIEFLVHKTIKKVGEDIEEMRFNTAISAMMILLNELEKEEKITKENYEIFIKILAPFAPHMTEEIWANLKNKKSIHLESWPQYDASKLVEDTVNIMIQINGKVRGMFPVDINMDESVIKEKVIQMPEIKKWIDGKEIKKVIYIKGKVMNLVIL
jgi:leucyl-tRNA synthetase